MTLPGAPPPAENTMGPRNPLPRRLPPQLHIPEESATTKNSLGPLLEATPPLHENTVPEHCSLKSTSALQREPLYREIAPEGCTGTVFPKAVPQDCSRTPYRDAVQVHPSRTLFHLLLGYPLNKQCVLLAETRKIATSMQVRYLLSHGFESQ